MNQQPFLYSPNFSIKLKNNPQEKNRIYERWEFEFQLVTNKRVYVLFAPSYDEYSLWLHTFKWIIHRGAFLKRAAEFKKDEKNNQDIETADEKEGNTQ